MEERKYNYTNEKLIDANFEKANLSEINFEKCSFMNSYFKKANFKNAFFYGCNNSGDLDTMSIFDSAIFDTVKIIDSNLQFCSFQETIFKNCVIEESTFTGCIFDDAFFENVKFINCKFCEDSLNYLDLTTTEFLDCEIVGSDFKETKIYQSCFGLQTKTIDSNIKYLTKETVINETKNESVNQEIKEEPKFITSNEYYTMGEKYFYGLGVLTDYKKALEYFEIAKKDIVNSYYFIGYCYYYGHYYQLNMVLALENLEKCASTNLKACDLIGQYYYSIKNYQKAVEYYTKVESKDFTLALFGLGCCNYYGYSIPINYEKAIKYFERAGNLGHILSQSWVGFMCYTGHPVLDYHKAIIWFQKAAKSNDQYSKNYLNPTYVLNTLKNQSYYDILTKQLGGV